MSTAHENLERDEPEGSSDRGFGIVFAIAAAAIGAYQFWRGAGGVWEWFAAAGLFLVLGLIAPRALAPLNRAWMLLGKLLNRVASPVAMAIVFFLAVTPVALVMRSRHRKLVPLHPDPAAKSYWIRREPPGPEPETMSRQF